MSLDDAIAAVAELESFARAAAIGLVHSSEATQWVRVSREVADVLKRPAPYANEQEFEQALEAAQKEETFAANERKAGFPYLNGMAAIRLWTILEVAVEDLALDVLKNPTPSVSDVLRGLKGPLLEFAAASPDQQAEFLLGELKLTLKATLKSGVGRFEALLSPLGLGGAVDDYVRKALLELSVVRNVLVHRSGIADLRVIASCPWRNWQTGAQVSVSGQDLAMYECAVLWYLTALSLRIVVGRETIDQEYLERGKKIAATFAQGAEKAFEARAQRERQAPAVPVA
jgi:hypothetical protein